MGTLLIAFISLIINYIIHYTYNDHEWLIMDFHILGKKETQRKAFNFHLLQRQREDGIPCDMPGEWQKYRWIWKCNTESKVWMPRCLTVSAHFCNHLLGIFTWPNAQIIYAQYNFLFILYSNNWQLLCFNFWGDC